MQNKVLVIIFCLSVCCFQDSMAQWNPNPALNTPVCLSNGNQIDLRMMEDGHSGTFITWKDYRPSNGLPDIYIQRINSNGVPMWTGNGVVVCDETHDQSTPAIVTDMRGGVIVSWSDWRSSIERDIYAQRIDSGGNVKWTINGANVTNLSQREHSEKIVSDGKGGVIIVFEKQNGLWDIWAQRLDSSGNKMWGAGGVAVSTATGNKRNHKVQKDKNGGAIVTWQDLRNGTNYDIYAQRLDANGNLKWGPNAKAICAAIGDQINAKIEADSSSNGAYIAWQDTRISSDYDIYMQRVDSNGNIKWATDGIVISNAVQNQSALDMMAFSGGNEVIITWKDKRNGNYDIYAQKINNMGAFQWNVSGVVVCNSPFDQINPNICSDANKGAIIVWQDSSAGKWDVKSQRVSNAGAMLWSTNGEVVCNAIDEQTSPKNVSDGNGGAIYAWQDSRFGEDDIYVHHINKWATGISSVELKNKLHAYPNPATDKVTVSFPEEFAITNVMVNNMLGEKTNMPFTISANQQIEIDIHTLVPGLYTVQLFSEMERVSCKLLKK